MKFLTTILGMSVANQSMLPYHRQAYEEHWEKQGSNLTRSGLGETADQTTADLDLKGSIVVWRRCSIANGTVYKRRAGQSIHPTPVQISCAPGFTLKDRDGKKFKSAKTNSIVCKARQIQPTGLKCVQSMYDVIVCLFVYIFV